ncbi:MAG: recombinase family protein [Sarcina sp.]
MKKIAIYSRKSRFTGKGDSIENQIEMCKDHIEKMFDKNFEITIYEDEGFSGSNINRPKFQELMNAIENKNIDLLICYRLDRISRNVADFSSILDTLQENNVDFISIKEQFDTSSPMGRAMIYIASVFAQLERETIAERIKDNMIEMAKNGKWTGGKIPFGFKSEKKVIIDDNSNKKTNSLLVHNEKIKVVELLYKKYLELGSLHKLEVYCSKNNITSSSNKVFEKTTLKIILQNPVYVKANEAVVQYLRNNDWIVFGDVDNNKALLTYNKTESYNKKGKNIKALKDKSERFAAVSEIDGYISPELFLKVQLQFDKNRESFPRTGTSHTALVSGKLLCNKCGSHMRVQHGHKSKVTNETLYYYVCSRKKLSKDLCDCKNAKSKELDNLVLNALEKFAEFREAILAALKNNTKKTNTQDTEIKSLECSLSDKKMQIDTLVLKLADDKANAITDILMAKIYELKKECEEINMNISNLQKQKFNIENNSLDLEFLGNILNLCAIIKTLEHEEQKRIINALVANIIYFTNEDNTYNIQLNFIRELDMDSLSFLSKQSMPRI